ncbi:MAG: ion channel [Pseudomonadota bacterium]
MFGGQLVLGTLIVVITVFFHIVCLVCLAGLLRRCVNNHPALRKTAGTILVLGLSVTALIVVHTVEAWGWAVVYVALGEFGDMSTALYFSVVTATTVGYGDLVLSRDWQILGSFESIGGWILFGTSTAFLLGVMRGLFRESTDWFH